MTPYQISRLALDLHEKLSDILDNDLNYDGHVSISICNQIIIHHFRDMDRLYAVHQKLVQPSKHIAYLAFWIRKLKPVSQAYKKASVTKYGSKERLIAEFPQEEVEDVNEKCSLYYAVALLNTFLQSGNIKVPSGMTKVAYTTRLANIMGDYFRGDDSSGMNLGNRYEAVLYDMRYRTFGPHHFVHIINHLLAEAAHP
ncbi:hypothetical protein [Methylobacterium bullatum]|uniref:hypothetical protein n=1 Tax=Methylobacterium bullatum TaxID=570505 RepID=UPI0030D4F39F